MDEEMEEFVREVYGGAEIDVDYEFDAPQFWDFNREESVWEAEETEDWFRFAGSHPPSPFIIKLLNWQKGINVEVVKTSSESEDGERIRHVDNDSSNCMEAEVSEASDDDNLREFCNQAAQDTQKAKLKSPDKSPSLSRSSTLMKPTASQLAKQIQRREAQSNRFLRRFGKKLGKFVENPQKSPPADSLGTKRQKLEAGYLRKVAELKHQPALLHKWPRKVGADVFSVNTRPRVTVPKEPNLETAHRAQRRRYKANGKPGEQAKIHKARSLTPKKSTIPATEFQQVFRLRTAARAMQQTVNNVTNAPNSCSLSQDETTQLNGPNSVYAFKQERSEMIYKCAACSPKGKTFQSDGENGVFSNVKQVSRRRRELKFSLDKRFVKEPPTDLFSKLSLASEAQNNAKAQSKSAFAC